jgi:hypothetical protein
MPNLDEIKNLLESMKHNLYSLNEIYTAVDEHFCVIEDELNRKDPDNFTFTVWTDPDHDNESLTVSLYRIGSKNVNLWETVYTITNVQKQEA